MTTVNGNVDESDWYLGARLICRNSCVINCPPFLEIIKILVGPCKFWLCSFSKPYIALMWRKLLKWVLKAKLLVIVQYVGVAKVLMNSERRLYKTSLSYFLVFFLLFTKSSSKKLILFLDGCSCVPITKLFKQLFFLQKI